MPGTASSNGGSATPSRSGRIFFGFVADRIGPRRLYPVVLVGWSIAGIASPLASVAWVANALGTPSDFVDSIARIRCRLLRRPLADDGHPGLGEYRWLFVCRTVLGLFEAGHWPCALLTARNILTDTQRPLGQQHPPERGVARGRAHASGDPGNPGDRSARGRPRS